MLKLGLGLIASLSLIGCQANTAAETPSETPLAKMMDINPIYINQHGFSPNSPKLAFYRGELDSPSDWALYNNQDDVVLRGQTDPVGYSVTADQHLNKIDISEVTTLGKDYYLVVDGVKSPTFDIAKGLYKSLKYDALAYFYHARAGEPIKAPYVARKHARPAGHTQEIVTCFKGTDEWGTDWPGCDYHLDVTGGWYDAGDHGKYVVNSGISTWTLLNAYEQFGEDFADGKVNIPEAGNGVNDLLDEARKNIEWMLSMQVPKGTKMKLPVGQQEKGKPLKLTEVDASGMVHHKVHDEKWTSGTTMPHQDKEVRYLYPPSTGATLNVAAIGAQCARIWKEIDAAFAERCYQATHNAVKSVGEYNPLPQNYDDIDLIDLPRRNMAYAGELAPSPGPLKTSDDVSVFGYNNFDGGGPYGDLSFEDEGVWVRSEIAGLSGTYQKTRRLICENCDGVDISTPSFNKTSMLGLVSLATKGQNQNAQNLIIETAGSYLADTTQEKLHFPFYKEKYSWGGNSEFANRAIVLGTAYQLTSEKKYRDGVVHLMDYLLGRNPMGVSYITGYGDNPYKNPHHRFWAKSIDETRPDPPAGVLSGGPNNDNMADPIAETMIGTCAAQTCWVDDHGAWSLNEVTINWNAPLFWMATFLDATEETPRNAP